MLRSVTVDMHNTIRYYIAIFDLRQELTAARK